MSMNEDITNIDDSDIDFGQLDSKEKSGQDAADAIVVEPAEAENGFGWIWIVAGIGAAFLLFLILLIGKKRKKEEEKV